MEIHSGTAAAREFCRIITGENAHLTFEGYFPKGHSRQTEPGRTTGMFDECLPTLEQWAYEGRSVYVRVNVGGSTKTDITAVRAISIEFDAPEDHHSRHQSVPTEWHLIPSVQVVRGESVHAHWIVTGCPVAAFDHYQRRAQSFYRSDPNTLGIQRIWRMPGFPHPLFPGEEVQLVVGCSEPYTVEAFERGLPLLSQGDEARRPHIQSVEDTMPISAADLTEILGFIDPTFANDYDKWVGIAKAIWWGQLPIHGDEEPNWNELADNWCSGKLWRDRTQTKAFEVSTYRGTSHLRNELGSPRDDGLKVGLGSLIWLARQSGYKLSLAWMVENLPDEVAKSCNAFVSEQGGMWAEVDLECDVGNKPLLARDLMRGNFPRVQFVWDKHLVEGCPNLLTGDGGVGKTTFALQLAASVASGREFLGLPVKQMPVLMMLAEDDNGETKHRYKLACDALEVPADELEVHFWCRPGLDSTIAIVTDEGQIHHQPFAAPLLREVKTLGPCLVVLDTVVDIAVLNENSRVPVNTLAKQVLGQLCRQTSATLLVTAHPSKGSMDSGSYYSGSTAWNGAFRSRMVLKVDDHEPSKRTLELAKSNYSAADPIDLYMHDGLLVTNSAFQTSDGQRELEAVRDLVFEYIDRDIRVVRGNGNGHKPRDLVVPLRERGFRLLPRKILDYLNILEFRGVLKYQSADKNDRGSRAGFVRGPMANGPLG